MAWLATYLALSLFVCAPLGWYVGTERHAANVGLALGAVLGPLGVVAMLFVDLRRKCIHCGNRLEGYPIYCPHCGE